MERVLAVIHLCKKLDKQEQKFEHNISSKCDIQKFRLKVCVIPKQNDLSSCGVIVMMAICQIYIQKKNVKQLYSKSNFQKFQYLFYHTLFQTAKIVLNYKIQQWQEKKKNNDDE